MLAGCGGHKNTTVSDIPAPPPTISEPTEPPAHGKVLYTEVGLASWYGPEFNNRRTSSGEIFDMHQPTAAHRTLPLNSMVRVTNLTNGKSTLVRINDRGPFVQGRIIDLSVAAAKAIDMWRAGVAKVRLEVVDTPAPIASGGRWCVQIGAFEDRGDAASWKERLTRRYKSAKVLQFSGPTGEWLRVRVPNDERGRAQEIAGAIHPGTDVWLVRMD